VRHGFLRLYPFAICLRLKIQQWVNGWFWGFPMRLTPRLLSGFVFVLASIPAIPQQAKAEDEVIPQMVWLNYAEGVVKFSPGRNGEAHLGNTWIEASPGQVMAEGYTLATEKGRAEIEFENGAVVYLAEGSVLEFNWLRVTPWQTETQLSLVTGTATVAHVVGQDPIRIATSTENFKFAGTETARLESTLDGAVIHSVSGVVAPIVEDAPLKEFLESGESAAIVDGHLVPMKEGAQISDEAAWDQWVQQRLDERHALIAEGMKEMALREPTPGLAAMVQNGKFSDCAPYGKCWEPNGVAEQEEEAARATPTGAQTTTPTAQTASSAPQNGPGKPATKRKRPGPVVNAALLIRCPMEAWVVAAALWSAPIEYGTCFYGTWEHHRFVARHHHKHPVYYVKVKQGIGIIPKHPLDEKGKTPINAKSGILVLAMEKGQLRAETQSIPPKGIQFLENPPSRLDARFDHGLVANAPRVAPPVIQAKLNENILPHEILTAARTGETRNLTNIHYDYKSNAFVGSTGAAGNVHAQVVAHVDSGFGHASTVTNGGSHESSSGGAGSSGGHSGSSSSSSSSSSSAASSASASSGGGGGHH
jgi:uncharacterized membrane protein YgcG